MPQFSTPTKRIFETSDLQTFSRSVAYKRLHQTINFLIDKVKGKDVPPGFLNLAIISRRAATPSECDSNNDSYGKLSSSARQIIHIFDKLNQLIDDTPPLKGPRRFGNMACRDWHAKIQSNIDSLLSPIVPNDGARGELEYYLVNSFGSSLRLDYGLGHELSFVAFLGGLIECNFIGEDFDGCELLAVFAKYYDLVRRLIIDYNLEPAGSHGVWGLDDHFHFIYILGAAQFIHEDSKAGVHYVPPVRGVLTPETIEGFQLANLYVNAIAFIFKIKSGPFNEHSPILFDIHRSVTLWSKVLSGLLKMYEVEVFGKFPVVQHFWFGQGFFPWKDAQTMKDLPVREHDETATGNLDADAGIPGLIAGLHGHKTTRSNISMTAAPWASTGNQSTAAAMQSRGPGSAPLSRFTPRKP